MKNAAKETFAAFFYLGAYPLELDIPIIFLNDRFLRPYFQWDLQWIRL
jgi:hypothetical protein